MGRWPAAAIAVVATLVGLATTANAQDDESATPTSVFSRPREDYDPLGLRLGQFVVDPAVDLLGAFDSNIYAAPRGAASDFVTTLLPSLSLRSDWAQNALGLRAQGEFKRYAIHGSENVNNGSVAGTGRFDLGQDTYLLGGGGFQLLHEDRSSPNAVDGRNPTEYTVSSGNAGFVWEPDRLGFRIDGTVDAYAYDNVSAENGAILNETARNRIVYALTPRLSYEITPQYNAFVRAVVNTRQYTSTREADGLDRNSSGYAVDLGTTLNLAALITGEFYVGYLQQNYDTSSARPTSAVDFGSNLLWNLGELTSLRLNVTRTIEESTLIGSPAYLQTLVRLSLEHELLSNVLVDASFTYINADFIGVPGSSDFYQLGLGARYLVNRNFSVGLDYDLQHRSAIEGLSRFTRQLVEVRLRGQM